MTATKLLLRRSILASTLAAPMLARAQTMLPDRGLRIVVGFGAGGGSDAMARLIATALERRVGRRVSVENRPGGTGTAAAEALKIGAPDGTTVAFMPTPSLIAKLFAPALPFDPLRDLAPITAAGTFLDAFAVSSRIGVSTMAEYVRWLKEGDGERTRLGTTATNGTLQFYVRLLSRELGVPLDGLAFRGTAALIADMNEGRVPAGVAGLTSFLVAHRGNRIRILATSGSRRVPVAPDLPTAAEAGFPGLRMEEWYGFYAAAATQVPLIDAWNHELVAVLKDKEVRDQLVQFGLDVETSTPAETATRVASHLKHWQATLESLGLKPTN